MPSKKVLVYKVISLLVVFLFVIGLPAILSPVVASSASLSSIHRTMPRNAPAASTQGAFAFVSNFETGTLEGWQSVSGAAPSVVTKPDYSGEPSLASSANQGTQVDTANSNFVLGDSFVSFQFAIDAKKGSGYSGLADSTGSPVAIVGVSNGQVVAGPSLSSLQTIEPIPSGTAYPSGWAYITANVYDASTTSNPTAGWVMQLFVDRTDQIASTLSVPNAGSYASAIIETTSGTVYYTNIVVTSYEIGINIPGYNNMEGYGQGSGLLVSLLPEFNNLSAHMVLNSWNTPQEGILSFQINAMNYYGTTRSSCKGFFQLGVDLNPNGYISPWYVPGVNCFAHYFLPSNNPAVQPGIPSPQGTHLTLSIVDNQSAKSIIFTIVDTTTSQTFSASIPYNGTAFYGAYTQLEFQPCCASYPIQDYQINAALYNMQITTISGQTQSLNSNYMLPFVLDAPPSWDFTYYQNSVSAYQQIS
ncbi:MAG: hypothetical protein JRN52_07835 [Nitrososphaerota archaeon]|nr:hypothetical protein [Nitrososphaerota archaeon]